MTTQAEPLATPTVFEMIAELLKRHRELAVLGALDLKPEDLAIVAGGYKGETVAFLRALYDCEVATYEPQRWACSELQSRFADDSKVHAHSYGLGVVDGKLPMYEYGTDACSFLPLEGSRQTELGHLVNIGAVFDQFGTMDHEQLGALVLNIEGYEYQLLRAMFDKGLTDRCRWIVVQFHQLDKYDQDLERVKRGLAWGHELVWEVSNWKAWKRA